MIYPAVRIEKGYVKVVVVGASVPAQFMEDVNFELVNLHIRANDFHYNHFIIISCLADILVFKNIILQNVFSSMPFCAQLDERPADHYVLTHSPFPLMLHYVQCNALTYRWTR